MATVKAVYTEVNVKELYEHCALYPEIRDWFECQGFVVAREYLHWQDMGNGLFVRKELLS